ncbi:hypothetical protein TNCV_1367661 [Trichonephila clavipes]|nr:hypothetical protein TNCV_1367661 [Trichonephila clavipes]
MGIVEGLAHSHGPFDGEKQAQIAILRSPEDHLPWVAVPTTFFASITEYLRYLRTDSLNTLEGPPSNPQ